MPISPLPINDVLPELRTALAQHQIVILTAPTGSGKTTGVPLALLDQAWLAGRGIIILEPRRLAARAAAARMAATIGEPVGQTVGYQIRFEKRRSSLTRIEVLTEGILTRRLQHDPSLAQTGLIILDEFHERSLQADLGLALCLDMMSCLRDDLRLLIMSATLGVDHLSRFLNQAPIISGTGVSYPVTVSYLERLPEVGAIRQGAPLADHIARLTASGIRRALAEQPGDVLAFLPGSGEIRRTHALLTAPNQSITASIYPLFGDLPPAAQARALQPCPQGQRRVVLATAIAETSLTIEGISSVVDSGWSRIPVFEANSGLTRLKTVRVAKAVADQRRGRAGRLGPGHCYRLWTKALAQSLIPFLSPEILSADLASLALELALWGVSDPTQLAWLDPPPAGAFRQAQQLLQELDAIDQQGKITPTGQQMAALPLHPRLSHMLCAAARGDGGGIAYDLAALLSERDLVSGGGNQGGSADLDSRLHLLSRYRKEGAATIQAMGGNPALCAQIVRASAQLQKIAPRRSPSPGEGDALSPAGLASLAYPDRIARRRHEGGTQYLLANGREARLAERDPLRNSEFLAVMQLDASQPGGRITLASPLTMNEITTLHAHHLHHEDQVEWDERERLVRARQVCKLGQLTISERPLPKPAPERLTAALLEGIRCQGASSLPWTDEAQQLRARVLSLRQWRPEQGWPEMSDTHLLATLEAWLQPYLSPNRSLDQLAKINLSTLLTNLLPWPQQSLLNEGAPSHILAPSGSRLRVRYSPNEPPTLAVRLQEMFGLAETPKVCWGQVPCLLHLLSPARRPIQITQDLRGFWDTTYHQIKKELQGRYPKHCWPDNPWQATPTAKVKGRGGEGRGGKVKGG